MVATCFAVLHTFVTRGEFDIPVRVELIGRVRSGPDENVWTPDLGQCVAIERVEGRALDPASGVAPGEVIDLIDADRETIYALAAERSEAAMCLEYESEAYPYNFDQRATYRKAA